MAPCGGNQKWVRLTRRLKVIKFEIILDIPMHFQENAEIEHPLVMKYEELQVVVVRDSTWLLMLMTKPLLVNLAFAIVKLLGQ